MRGRRAAGVVALGTVSGAVLGAACASGGGRAGAPAGDAAPAVPAALDHVILGVDSLERGVALLRAATGVAPVDGGVHPGRGTRNALLALGGNRYLELLAPNPADPASRGPSGTVRGLDAYRRPTLVGWAMRVTDADSARATFVAAGLDAGETTPGARTRPDGRRLAWTTLLPWGLRAANAHDVALPFAIAWSAETAHPSADAPAGCTLAAFTIVTPDADSVRTLLARAGVAARVRSGAREQLAVALDCPRGRVTFP